ncbi:hypothetical protein ATANTOWER_019839 [Ataeniobius toweri]|uniref:Uncharacterized protein n=1 Tax=Ataeniobius toweri TaxID=208326 RepID=A0ABU7BN89_9TELE|nr:hypothetical protein [Ataeniobius toweri]
MEIHLNWLAKGQHKSKTQPRGQIHSNQRSWRSLVWGVAIALVLICGSLVASVSIFCCRKMHHNRKLQVVKETEEQTKHAPSVEQFTQEKTTREVTCQLIKRSSSKQASPVTPTTPDVESCSLEGINLHQKLKGRKSS